jgi:hypothetical protein
VLFIKKKGSSPLDPHFNQIPQTLYQEGSQTNSMWQCSSRKDIHCYAVQGWQIYQRCIANIGGCLPGEKNQAQKWR